MSGPPVKKSPSPMLTTILIMVPTTFLTHYLRYLGMLSPYVFLLIFWIAMLVGMAWQGRNTDQPFKPVAIVVTGIVFCGLIAIETRSLIISVGALFVLAYLANKTKIFQS